MGLVIAGEATAPAEGFIVVAVSALALGVVLAGVRLNPGLEILPDGGKSRMRRFQAVLLPLGLIVLGWAIGLGLDALRSAL